MKAKILTAVLGIVLIAGIGTSIYFAVDNNKTQAVVAEVTADADKIASENNEQSPDVQKLKTDYDEAQKNGQDLVATLENAQMQQDAMYRTENGYVLETIAESSAKISVEQADVLLGASDEYDVAETLAKDTQIIVDAKATNQTEVFYRIKDTTHFVSEKSIELGGTDDEE